MVTISTTLIQLDAFYENADGTHYTKPTWINPASIGSMVAREAGEVGRPYAHTYILYAVANATLDMRVAQTPEAIAEQLRECGITQTPTA